MLTMNTDIIIAINQRHISCRHDITAFSFIENVLAKRNFITGTGPFRLLLKLKRRMDDIFTLSRKLIRNIERDIFFRLRSDNNFFIFTPNRLPFMTDGKRQHHITRIRKQTFVMDTDTISIRFDFDILIQITNFMHFRCQLPVRIDDPIQTEIIICRTVVKVTDIRNEVFSVFIFFQDSLIKDEYGKDFIAYGGDFNDRPTDYNFCLNGIVYADRELTPKMHEVRYL